MTEVRQDLVFGIVMEVCDGRPLEDFDKAYESIIKAGYKPTPKFDFGGAPDDIRQFLTRAVTMGSVYFNGLSYQLTTEGALGSAELLAEYDGWPIREELTDLVRKSID